MHPKKPKVFKISVKVQFSGTPIDSYGSQEFRGARLKIIDQGSDSQPGCREEVLGVPLNIVALMSFVNVLLLIVPQIVI